jgi:oligoendopeptidase F
MLETLPTTQEQFMHWSWVELEPYYQELLARPFDAATVTDWLSDWSHLSDLASEIYARLNVAVTVDTADEQAEARYNAFLDGVHSQVQAAEQSLKKRLLESGLEPEGLAVPLRKMRAEAAIFREENLPLLAEERKLAAAYNKIVGAQAIQWNGEELTLQQIRRVYETPDRRAREQAWRLAAQRQIADREALNANWRQMLDLRRRLAANAGLADFRSYRWQQMLRLDYTPADCDEFRQAIEDVVVPVATRHYAMHRQQLGVNSLRPWDLDQDLYPLEIPPLPGYGSLEDLVLKAQVIFEKVDPEFGEEFLLMCQEGLLDLPNRKGKAPGAYCTGFAVSQRPFVFMNAVGVAGDVRTILHESGHAFHNFDRLRLPYAVQRAPGLEFAEVASMAMELLASPHLDSAPLGFYTAEGARRFRIQHLEHIIFFWPYMAVVDGFQHWAYTHPEQADEPSSCDACWLELWRRFLPGVDWGGLEQEAMTGWHRKQHIHRYPFYYIEYGVAQLGAVQVWSNALNDPEAALASYRQALELGGTRNLPDLYAAAGAKFAFDAGTLGQAVRLIEDTLQSLEI